MKITIYKDEKYEYRWKLTARNGKILADSGEGYLKSTHCRKMVDKIFGDKYKVVIDL